MNELPDEARLKAMLVASGETPEDADSLAQTARLLRHLPTPEGDGRRKAMLIETIRREIGAATVSPDATPGGFPLSMQWGGGGGMGLIGLWLLLRAQVRIVRREIWLASFFLMALGMFVSFAFYAPGKAAPVMPFVLVAPLVAALGVSFIYGPEVDPPVEILMATPISPRLVLLARLTLLFGFDLALGLGASFSLATSLAGFGVSLWPLVLNWLAPMAFLSALAFLCGAVFLDPLIGVLVSLCAWFALCAGHIAPAIGHTTFLPDLIAPHSQPVVWMLALSLGLASLWLVGREEHWIG